MEDSILKLVEQFEWEPQITNEEKIKEGGYKNYVLGGMGGSHLAAELLHTYKPGINLYIHRDYGIPAYDDEFCDNSLFIASSYSGNTEEVVDFLDEVYSKGYDVLVIAIGGKLIEFAEANGLPYIQIPDTGIQPRSALGYSILSIASVVLPEAMEELKSMAEILQPESLKEEGFNLAESLGEKIPVIYTSTKNKAIGYNWKIKMNETGKIPAFCNVLPELNHNEMQGFDPESGGAAKNNVDNFHFFLIHDPEDHLRIAKRMEVIEGLLQEKGYPVTRLYLEGEFPFEKIFRSLILADWFSLGVTQKNGSEPEQVPMIEEFKKRLI